MIWPYSSKIRARSQVLNEGRVVFVDTDLIVRIVLGEVAFDYTAWEARGLGNNLRAKGAHDGNSDSREKMWIAILVSSNDIIVQLET